MSFLFKKVAAQDADAAPKFHVGQIVKPKSIKAGSELRFKVAQVGGRAVYGRKDPLAEKEAGQTMYSIERIGDPYGTGGIGKTGFYAENDLVAVDAAAKDAAEFKVGDKVKHTQYGTIGKVFEIDPAGNVGVQWNNGQAYYGKTAKPLSLIIAADSAAMDDLNDGIKTIENKARALIADAKNARSKYADILARSEIANNNAQVKKTFEDDIARCDKLINALKAI